MRTDSKKETQKMPPPQQMLQNLVLFVFVLLSAQTLHVTLVLAQGIGGVATSVTSNLQVVPNVIAILAYIIGAILCFIGLMVCNKAKRFPQQQEMGTGIVTFLVGVGLIFLPVVINWIFGSFGSGSTTLAAPRF